MNKIGYVAGCLGLNLTAKTIGMPYRQLSENIFNPKAFNRDYRARIEVIAEILIKAERRAETDQKDLVIWLNTQHAALNGASPLQFISTMKSSNGIRGAHALMQMAPNLVSAQGLTLAA